MEDGHDFSGLPEARGRGRGRLVRIGVVAGLLMTLVLVAVALVVLYVPAPYLGTGHRALAHSVANGRGGECRPARGNWICRAGESDAPRYAVEVDWAGCWSATLIEPGLESAYSPEKSGCVALIDYLRAD